MKLITFFISSIPKSVFYSNIIVILIEVVTSFDSLFGDIIYVFTEYFLHAIDFFKT